MSRLSGATFERQLNDAMCDRFIGLIERRRERLRDAAVAGGSKPEEAEAGVSTRWQAVPLDIPSVPVAERRSFEATAEDFLRPLPRDYCGCCGAPCGWGTPPTCFDCVRDANRIHLACLRRSDCPTLSGQAAQFSFEEGIPRELPIMPEPSSYECVPDEGGYQSIDLGEADSRFRLENS